MNDDTSCAEADAVDATDNSNQGTYTRAVSCAVGDRLVKPLRQSLRAKLKRERHERKKQLENSFIFSFRNLLKDF